MFFQVIILDLGFFLYHHSLVAYGMIACLIEVNSIFLHIRMLLIMYGYPKTSLTFRVNNIINLLTFLVFRMGALVAFVPFVFEDSVHLTVMWCYFFRFSSLTLFVISLILLYRLLKSDFLSKGLQRGSLDESDIMGNNNVNGHYMDGKSK